jgi:hypothetical protein
MRGSANRVPGTDPLIYIVGVSRGSLNLSSNTEPMRRLQMISAAVHQVIFFAMAFNNTSCSFIIRSISAAEYRCSVLTVPYRRFLKADTSCVNSTGQIVC